MRRILVILTSLAIALFAAPSNPVLGAQSTLQIYPPTKYVPLTLSSYAETNVDTALALGQTSANQSRGQGFKVPVSRTVGRASLWLKTNGSPTDDLTVEIQTDSGGLPSGTPVSGGTSAVVQGRDYPETNVDTDLALGQDGTNVSRAQGFQVLTDRSVSQVKLYVKKSGTPTDNLTLQIQTDSGGLPSGTVVTNGTSGAVAGSSVGSSYGLVTFSFSPVPQLTANTQYQLVLTRSGSNDSANYYVWGADQSSPTYSNGAGSTYPVVFSYAESNVDTDLAMGQNTANERRAQGFKVSTSGIVSQVRLWLKKSGAPGDNLTLQIQTDSGSLPSGTVVANGLSSAVAGSSVSSSYGWVTFTFSVSPQLTANTQYHLVLTRSGSSDSANYYVWGADQSSPAYSNGVGSIYGAVLASYAETNVDTDLAMGQNTANERRAQGFKVPANRSASQVSLWLKKSGEPEDNLTLQIQTDNGGVPGTMVTNGLSSAVAGSNVDTSYGWVTFSFSTPPQLTANTQYHLVLTRSGSSDSANYYVWGADTSSPAYGDGAGSVYNGSTWQALPVTDHAFVVKNSNWQATFPAADHAFSVYSSNWQATSPSTDHAFRVIPASVSYGWVAFDFPTPPQLTAGTPPGTQYHLVLKRSGSPDNTNYYVWGADQSSPSYVDGAGSVYSGSWQATSPGTDHAFQVRPAFIVQVYATVVGTTTVCPYPDGSQPCGLGGYGFTVLFDPTAMKYVSVQDGPFLTSTGRLPVLCDISGSHNPLSGAVGYNCFSSGNPPGATTPLGPEGSGVLAEITFVPLAVGITALQFQDAVLAEAGLLATQIPLTTGNGTVTVGNYGTADSDGDGCADIEETGDDPTKGGNRNPNAWYDFYDVPVPSLRAGPGGTYNGSVGLGDVLAVNTYSGVRAGQAAYEADVNGNGTHDGLEYDRSPSPPPNPGYDAGPPDGYIGISDVLNANTESGSRCSLGHHY